MLEIVAQAAIIAARLALIISLAMTIGILHKIPQFAGEGPSTKFQLVDRIRDPGIPQV